MERKCTGMFTNDRKKKVGTLKNNKIKKGKEKGSDFEK